MSIIADIIGEVIETVVSGLFDGLASSIRRRWGVPGCILAVLLVAAIIGGLIWLAIRTT